jgi:glycosyltransferase involved in cell wall biosynthesis
MIYIIHDKKEHSNFIINGLNDLEIESKDLKYTFVNINLLSWINGALYSIYQSKGNDILIFWFDFQAILCWLFSIILFRPRKIIALNILLKNKSTLKNKIVSVLYRKALNSSNLKATVTSKELPDILNRKLNSDIQFTLLHDVYNIDKKHEISFADNGQTVFVGGLNGRDWDTAFNVAEKMQNVHFTFVCSSTIYDKFKLKNISNLDLYHSIPYDHFISLQSKCSITFLPLDTESPAGLIVLFQAVSLNKFVVTSDTFTTKEYILDGVSGSLVPLYDDGQCVDKLNYYLNNFEKRRAASLSLSDFLKTECSENKYIESLINVIKSF